MFRDRVDPAIQSRINMYDGGNIETWGYEIHPHIGLLYCVLHSKIQVSRSIRGVGCETYDCTLSESKDIE